MTMSCRSLEFLPLNSFPNLSSLSISECEMLQSIGVFSDGNGSTSESHSLTSLSDISISGCPSFTSFLEGGLHAPNLTSLRVSVDKLKELPEQMQNHLPSLKCLDISYCSELESFPESGLPSNLTSLTVSVCNKLKKLPKQMHNLLPSLDYLWISDCPEIESFTEGSLPSNLTHLRVFNCPKLMAQRMNWNLHALQALKNFTVGDENGGGGVETFPEKGLLPSTLSSLCIRGFPDLKRLDIEGLQNLTSLKYLHIESCPQLRKLPSLATSVDHLEIVECPNLEESAKAKQPQESFTED